MNIKTCAAGRELWKNGKEKCLSKKENHKEELVKNLYSLRGKLQLIEAMSREGGRE